MTPSAQLIGHHLSFEPVSQTRKTFVVLITPEQATEILERYAGHNRSLKYAHIEALARDMKSGTFAVTNQGLAFAKDGTLIDGQHRLWACVEAGVPFETNVTVGLDLSTRDVIDVGMRRTEADVLQMHSGIKVAPLYVATGRVLYSPLRSKQQLLPRGEFLTFLETHQTAIAFAFSGWRGEETGLGGAVRLVTVAPVLGVVARAWHGSDRAELARFMKILTTGMPDAAGGNSYQPVLMLRNWLIQHGVHASVLERYQKTETALHCFLHNRPVRHRLWATQEELFPMEWEK